MSSPHPMSLLRDEPEELASFARFCGQLVLEDGSRMVLWPYQRAMLCDFFGGATETLILIPKKNGKALGIGEFIPTPDGMARMGDLRVGDKVFDERGKQCSVVGMTPVQYGRPCYRVTFSDKTSVVADAEHEWVTRNLAKKYKKATVTTEEIARTLTRNDGARNHSIDVAGPLECDEQTLPIDPYLLGAWLGDGISSSGGITFGEEFVYEELLRLGVELSHDYYAGRRLPAHHRTAYGLSTKLRAAGLLGNKHIPAAYLRASYAQRLALAQGLCDTDGTCSKAGQVEWTTIRKNLCDEMMELLRTLGLKPTLKVCEAKLDGRGMGPCYRVQVWPSTDNLFRNPRHIARRREVPNGRRRSNSRQIISVEPIDSVPVKCIEVDSPSHLYLCGDGMVPTHNSSTLAALALFHLLTTASAECVVAAASREQASILLNQARGLVRRSGLDKRLLVKQREIVNLQDEGRCRVMASDENTADGVIPTLAIVDELHRHKDNGAMYGVFRDGIGPRHGQMVTISTAGDDLDTPLGIMREAARAMPVVETDGAYTYARNEDGSYVMHEWGLGPGMDLNDLEQVKQANPAPWMTLGALARRHDSPSMTPWQWARFACGVWLKGEAAWLQGDQWALCREDGVQIPKGSDVWVGVDLGVRHDTTAIVTAWCRPDARWVVKARIMTPPGGDGAISISDVEDEIRKIRDKYRIRAVTYDPWSLRRSAEILGAEGIRMVEHPMAAERMAVASSNLFRLISEQALVHDGDPELAAHVLSATTKQTERGWRLVKDPRSKRPIDGCIALCVCMSTATALGGTSPYETRGVVFL